MCGERRSRADMRIHGRFQVGAAERQMRLFSLLSTSRSSIKTKRQENVNNNARVTRQEGPRQKYVGGARSKDPRQWARLRFFFSIFRLQFTIVFRHQTTSIPLSFEAVARILSDFITTVFDFIRTVLHHNALAPTSLMATPCPLPTTPALLHAHLRREVD